MCGGLGWKEFLEHGGGLLIEGLGVVAVSVAVADKKEMGGDLLCVGVQRKHEKIREKEDKESESSRKKRKEVGVKGTHGVRSVWVLGFGSLRAKIFEGLGCTVGGCDDGVTACGVSVGDGCNVGHACLRDRNIGADDVCAAFECGGEAFWIMLVFGGVCARANDQVGADSGLDLGFVAERRVDLDDGSERIVWFGSHKAKAV